MITNVIVVHQSICLKSCHVSGKFNAIRSEMLPSKSRKENKA